MLSAPEKYLAVLTEIKRRTQVIGGFMRGEIHALYEPTTVESVCLQFRKVLELIAFSSLIANVESYSRAHERFAEHWNARLMLRDLERVNTAFYPRPIIQQSSTAPGIKAHLIDRIDDYLSKDEFVKVYDKCGGLMHAANPFGPPVDYANYKHQFDIWRHYIINLLDSHTIRLTDDPHLYLFQMGAEGMSATFTPFAPKQ
jgi:hypothetical protein